MTIRQHFRLYIFSIIIIPAISLSLMCLYNYMTRPERILIEGTELIQKLHENNFSENEIENLKRELQKIPPDVEFLITKNRSQIIYSSSGNLSGLQENQMKNLYSTIWETCSEYTYQVVSPMQGDGENSIHIFMRFPKRAGAAKTYRRFWFNGIIAFVVIFEALLIIISWRLARTICKSIGILEAHTKQIVAGDLDSPMPQLKRTDNEITRLTYNLTKMQESLRDSEQRKTRFIMGISHDLRSPIAVIKGYTEAFKDNMLSTQAEKDTALALINDKTNQLENMINSLINFVRFESDDLRQSMMTQNLYDFLKERFTSSKTTSTFFKRNFSYSLNIPEDTFIPFNDKLLDRLLENMYSNAVKYTSEGDSISFNAEESSGEIILTFSNTGPAIPKKDIGHIFDLFYRASPARQDGGMGIGLSVVKTIVEAHGWKISVTSQAQKGTSFIITIPGIKEAPQETD